MRDLRHLPWLLPGQDFPATGDALDDPNGLLAIGGDLSVETLLRAYRRGIFPWFSDGQPVLWWSPTPRLVLLPDAFHLSRSLRKQLRRQPWQFSFDHAFEQVVARCAGSERPGQDGTWITADIEAAYVALHHAGHAHSVEVWQDGGLVGGFYGVHLGGVFFGESMFSAVADASKAALALLCALHQEHRISLVDCQVRTPHLVSLGAASVPRATFETLLAQRLPVPPGHWSWPHAPAPLAHYGRRYRLDFGLSALQIETP
ncbi:leucyl/phenylalanyl-tRNA--protein transferase [Isoalcanivorax beigongshangi]|uniref:Leucyl/phenylalanyl-tRNA--protein transferase n=1 Tax=Isoalcanivorax beigongshangi TaxID=3238810 RepID=A0ABV4AJS0_9GAMM